MSLARHTAFNLAGQLLPLALALVAIPAYIDLIGEARFGVLALVWLFLGYAGVLDLGVGQATGRELARLADTQSRERTTVLNAGVLTAAVVGVTTGILTALVGTWLIKHHAPIDSGLRAELLVAVPWAAAAIPAIAVAGVLNGALQAARRFGELNLIAVATSVLMTLGPLLIAAVVGIELGGLVATVAATRVLVLLVLVWRFRSQLALQASPAGSGTVRRLLAFGGWTTVSAVVAPLLLVADRFLIGAQLGVESVSRYTIPFQLAERTTALASAFGQAMFPRLAASKDESQRKELAYQGLRWLTLIGSPMVGLAILVVEPFLNWWISPTFASYSTLPAQILCVAFWLSGLATMPYTLLLAAGRPDLVAKGHVLQLLPYLGALVFALQQWGIVGAALAFALRVVADFVLLIWWSGLINRALKSLVLPLALIGACLYVATNLAPDPTLGRTIGIAIVAAWAAWSTHQLRQSMPFSGRSRL